MEVMKVPTRVAGIVRQVDAREMPLPDACVDLIVTSPPYWGLRSYSDAGEHYDGQIGSEVTPAEYVAELVGMIDGEWRRVLKPSGSMFLNLGDKYARSGGAGTTSGLGATPSAERGSERVFPKGLDSARPKSLLGLPWRIALALIDRGWILRAEIIWSKPNGLPESVTDRVRRSHEQIFHFTKEPRYYAAVDRIREPHASEPGREGKGALAGQKEMRPVGPNSGAYSPLGRLPGSVWQIATSPLVIPDSHKQHWNLPDHFAAYPPELVRRIVLGWSPERVCTRCGQGRRPVVRYSDEYAKRRGPGADWNKSIRGDGGYDGSGNRRTDGKACRAEYEMVGEACACPTPDAATIPGVVLDPMCGTGTTIGVAMLLNRVGIGFDLSADYCRLARYRCHVSDNFEKKAAKWRKEGLIHD